MSHTLIRRVTGVQAPVASATTAKQDTRPSGPELVGEVSDLAAGLGILTFTLAPLALPALALTALAGIALVIPALVGAMFAAPFLLASRWLRARDRLSGATKLDGSTRVKRAVQARPAD